MGQWGHQAWHQARYFIPRQPQSPRNTPAAAVVEKHVSYAACLHKPGPKRHAMVAGHDGQKVIYVLRRLLHQSSIFLHTWRLSLFDIFSIQHGRNNNVLGFGFRWFWALDRDTLGLVNTWELGWASIVILRFRVYRWSLFVQVMLFNANIDYFSCCILKDLSSAIWVLPVVFFDRHESMSTWQVILELARIMEYSLRSVPASICES